MYKECKEKVRSFFCPHSHSLFVKYRTTNIDNIFMSNIQYIFPFITFQRSLYTEQYAKFIVLEHLGLPDLERMSIQMVKRG